MLSFWEETMENKKQYQTVDKDIETEVCIIGGGLTGLSVGYYLCNKKNFIILEKEQICSKTSGKNTGKLTSEHGLFYKYLIDSNGKEYAKDYFNANQEAITNIEKIINNENIECDFEKDDSYVFSRNEKDSEEIKSEKNAVDKLDKEISKICQNIEIPVEIISALKFVNQAKFNPVKYGYGLANSIVKNAGKIYENSKVDGVKRVGDKYEISVNGYKVIANYVVIATRYPTINIPGYYFLKMYQSTSYAVIADTKTPLFKGMYISNDNPVISFRTVKSNNKELLLAVGFDYKTGKVDLTSGIENLKNTVKRMYPESEFLDEWFAEDCISLDKIPYIGDYSNMMKNIFVATGFNKWGLTTSNIAGKIISDKILGINNKYEYLYKSTRLEPIKNKEEFSEMIKEAKYSIIMSKFNLPNETIDSIKKGEGKIVDIDNKKVGVYKDENGKIYAVKPICTHLGCELEFNNFEKIWECPCHGSKFNYDGTCIEVPAVHDLNNKKF